VLHNRGILNPVTGGIREASDRQWRDVLGVLKVQGKRLDLAYMRHMATRLGAKDLLKRALEESV
jgi:hypothetical protein